MCDCTRSDETLNYSSMPCTQLPILQNYKMSFLDKVEKQNNKCGPQNGRRKLPRAKIWKSISKKKTENTLITQATKALSQMSQVRFVWQ